MAALAVFDLENPKIGIAFDRARNGLLGIALRISFGYSYPNPVAVRTTCRLQHKRCAIELVYLQENCSRDAIAAPYHKGLSTLDFANSNMRLDPDFGL